MSVIEIHSEEKILDHLLILIKKRIFDREKPWVSVGQRAARLQAVKVGGLKKILLCSMSRGGPGLTPGRLDHPPTLTACNFAVAISGTETHSTSLERS